MANLNTAIRGVQILDAVAADGLQKDGSGNFGVDVSDFIDTSYGLVANGEDIRVNITADIGLHFNAGALEIELDGSTLAVSASGIKVSAVSNTEIVADAAIALDKIVDMADTKIMIGSGSGNAEYALSGDITMTNAGVTTIGADAVEDSMVNDNVATGLAGVGLVASSGVLAVDLDEVPAAAVDVTADSIVILDGDDNGDTKKESIDDFVTALAGDGLQNSSSQLAVDVSAFAGKGVKDDGSENLDLDINGLDAAVVAVATDSIAILDSDDSESKKESIADFVSAIAGTGLTATNGVLAADAVADNIVEADIRLEDESGNVTGAETDFTLSATPVTNSLDVYLNGLRQQEGSGKDFTLTGTTVSFSTAPMSGAQLILRYIVND